MKAKKHECMCGCGKILRPNYEREWIPNPKVPGHMMEGKIIKLLGYGYLNNGRFATLTCGFRWAVRNTNSISRNT